MLLKYLQNNSFLRLSSSGIKNTSDRFGSPSLSSYHLAEVFGSDSEFNNGGPLTCHLDYLNLFGIINNRLGYEFNKLL